MRGAGKTVNLSTIENQVNRFLMSDPNTPSAAELAALISARVCHDLISPVSALSAALGVLEDPSASDMREDAMELLRSGISSAQAKLEFLRLAFGAGGSHPGLIETSELKRLAGAMFGHAKAELVWKTEAGGLPKPAAKVLLNLIWMAVDSVPRGGTVTVEASVSSGARIRIVAAGPKARLDESARLALSGAAPEDGYSGRSIQPYYTGLLARESGGRVDARAEDERVEYAALIASEADKAA
jgi:histidine phosphotransferase ChpT